MKKLISPKLKPETVWQSAIPRFRPILGGLLLSAAAANADVTLNFATGTQGVVAGGNATSVVWDSVGQRLEINTTGDWRPQCAFFDMGDVSANPDMAALKAELELALANGGTLSYDITVETTSVTGGDPGYFETIYIGNSSGGWDQTVGAGRNQITAYGAFPLSSPIHYTVSYPIVNGSAADDAIAQFGSSGGYYQINLGVNSAAGTTIKYYIDNFKIAANVVVAPLVAPKLSITPAKPGLHIIGSGTGQYDRYGIRTQGTDLSWSAPGSTYPKSYEMTISSLDYVGDRDIVMYFACPSATQESNGFGAGNSAPDYSAADCVIFSCHHNDISNPNAGSGILRYKVNNENSNNSLPGGTGRPYWEQDTAGDGNGGYIGDFLNSTKMTGTWKLTFSNATTYTITAPDGTVSPAYAMTATNSARFSGNMYVYVSCGVDGTGAQRFADTVISRLKITDGANTIIDENFTTGTYPSGTLAAEFQVSSAAASVIQVSPDTGSYWLSWTPVDPTFSGFSLIQSADLGLTDTWDASMATPIPTTGAFNSKIGKTMLLPAGSVNSTSQNFYRLQKVRP